MKNGIYKVVFSTDQGGYGEGLGVLKDGSVNGGDGSYLYVGTISEANGSRRASLQIKRWNSGGPPSVFGPLGDFSLNLTDGMRGADHDFYLVGGTSAAPGVKITIRCTKISDAA